MSDLAQPAPQTFKLTIAYDGTDFSGWQIQPGEPTIQGELQTALGRITGESPLPQGSGRTDAGVHALAQVASFQLQANIPPENLLRALNRTLPASIRILESRTVRSTFHARHSAIAKTYEYRVFQEAICPPTLARYVHACPWPMDVDALQTSARLFEGRHNFLSFAATDPDLTTRTADLTAESENAIPASEKLQPDVDVRRGLRPPQPAEEFRPNVEVRRSLSPPQPAEEFRPNVEVRRGTTSVVPKANLIERSGALAPADPLLLSQTAIRTIYSSTWHEQQSEAGPLLVYRVRGSGFLHHMVRNLVGTMLDVGRGRIPVADIPKILAAQSRAAAGPTAPAQGLFLHSVEYGIADSNYRTE